MKKNIFAIMLIVSILFAPAVYAWQSQEDVTIHPPSSPQSYTASTVQSAPAEDFATKKEVGKVKGMIKKYVDDLAGFKKSQSNYDKRLATVETVAAANSSRISTQSSKLEDIDQKLDDDARDLQNVKADSAAHANKIKNIEQKLDGVALKGDLDALGKNVKTTEDSVKHLSSTVGFIIASIVIMGILLVVLSYRLRSAGKKKNPAEKLAEVPTEKIKASLGDNLGGVAEIMVAIDNLGKKIEGKMDAIPGKVVSEMKKLDPTPFVFTLDHEGTKWQMTWDAYVPAKNCYDRIFVHNSVSDGDELHPETFELTQEFESRGIARRDFEKMMKKTIKYLTGKATPATIQEKVQVAVIKHLSKTKRLKIEMV